MNTRNKKCIHLKSIFSSGKQHGTKKPPLSWTCWTFCMISCSCQNVPGRGHTCTHSGSRKYLPNYEVILLSSSYTSLSEVVQLGPGQETHWWESQKTQCPHNSKDLRPGWVLPASSLYTHIQEKPRLPPGCRKHPSGSQEPDKIPHQQSHLTTNLSSLLGSLELHRWAFPPGLLGPKMV